MNIFLCRWFVILFFSTALFAQTGYIQHHIINRTPHRLYVGVRQQFSYPIDTCLGVIQANSEKECEGEFELGYANFMIEVIKNTSTREELRAFANLKNYVQNPSIYVTWILDLDDAANIQAKHQVQ